MSKLSWETVLDGANKVLDVQNMRRAREEWAELGRDTTSLVEGGFDDLMTGTVQLAVTENLVSNPSNPTRTLTNFCLRRKGWSK